MFNKKVDLIFYAIRHNINYFSFFSLKQIILQNLVCLVRTYTEIRGTSDNDVRQIQKKTNWNPFFVTVTT